VTKLLIACIIIPNEKMINSQMFIFIYIIEHILYLWFVLHLQYIP